MVRKAATAMTGIWIAFILVGCSGSLAVEQDYRVSSGTTLPVESEFAGPALRMSKAELASNSAVEAPAENPFALQRLVIYNGVIHVVVDRIADSIEQVKTDVEAVGGYMQAMTGTSITVKIPAAKFEALITRIESLGEVTHKDIKGTDVTEEMRDLKIRLANAETVRDRLTALLDKAEKVEDAIKIEKELERVTETIELLKGKIAAMENQIAFSTLTVRFNSPVPQHSITSITPFGWVHELGSGIVRRAPDSPYENRAIWQTTPFDLPAGYIKFYVDHYHTQAMSAAQVMIDLGKRDNYQGGSLPFWSELIRRVLVEEKAFAIRDQKTVDLHKGGRATLFVTGRQIGQKRYGYLIALAVTKKNVYVFECWGPEKEFTADQSKLEAAIKTLRLQ
ncbi:MAG: DUF4349 domain-containing protein [Sedimentisphaerales bacterium]|nr:DUF4349 domain-containing protein [Sedimentisphaerales bacterium]